MRIYLAARYGRRAELIVYAERLIARGHEITSRWLQGAHEILDEQIHAGQETKLIQRFAQEDLADLLRADCVIAFTESPRTRPSRGGRHVEFGIAWAMRKLLLVVGWRENVFYALPEVLFFDTADEAIAALPPAHTRG